MLSLLAPLAAPALTLATTPGADVLARRGGGRGIASAVYWVWRGIQTGNPVAIGLAVLGVAGVGFWIYSAVTGEGDA